MSVTTKKKADTETIHPHIERRPGVLDGEPVIEGTRVSVRHIVEWEGMGKSVDEIVEMYPHLSHAQVHDALSYYCDNKEEIDRFIRENSQESVRARYKDKPWMR